MKKEIMEIIKSKRFFFMIIILLLSFMESGKYDWLGGPIGIFGAYDRFYAIVDCFGSVFPMPTYAKQEVYEFFTARFEGCINPVAQLARGFADRLGIDYYMYSFLIGAFLVPGLDMKKSKNLRRIDPKTLCKKYFAAVFITMMILAALTLIPFLLSFRMKNINLSGSPGYFWYYLFTWVLPTVMLVYAMQVLVGVISESWIVTVIVHFILMFFMAVPSVNNYPFYKFIIRFNGRDEAFYLAMRNQIAANRIFISVLSVILLGLAVRIVQRKKG